MARTVTAKGHARKRHINLYPDQYDHLMDIAEAERKRRQVRVTLSELVRTAVDEWLQRRKKQR